LTSRPSTSIRPRTSRSSQRHHRRARGGREEGLAKPRRRGRPLGRPAPVQVIRKKLPNNSPPSSGRAPPHQGSERSHHEGYQRSALRAPRAERPRQAEAAVRRPRTPLRGYGYGDMDGMEENHFREYLRAVRKHLWLIIGLTLIATAASAVYVAQKPDIYTAQTRVQVDLESNPGAGATKNGTIVINGRRPTRPTSTRSYRTSRAPVCCAASSRRSTSNTTTRSCAPRRGRTARSGRTSSACSGYRRGRPTSRRARSPTNCRSPARSPRHGARGLGRGEAARPLRPHAPGGPHGRAGQGDAHELLQQGHAPDRHQVHPRRPAGGGQGRQRHRRHLRPLEP
jgi:hypothetical protein